MHNCNVQFGTGVHGMESRQASTEFTAMRPSLWPLGLAVGIGDFLTIRACVPRLLWRQKGQIAKGLNQGVSKVLGSSAWIMLEIFGLVALALIFRRYKYHKLIGIRATVESPVANGWCQFELLVGNAFPRQSRAVEETGLRSADCGIKPILRELVYRTLCNANN